MDYQPSQAPVGQLKTNRGLLKYILLSILTLGIYSSALAGLGRDSPQAANPE